MVILTGHLRALLIVLILALVIFGPKRIPEIATSLGQGVRGFKRGMAHLDEVTTEQTPGVAPKRAGPWLRRSSRRLSKQPRHQAAGLLDLSA
jgi:TatA/E family protein of Tat protein translocase